MSIYLTALVKCKPGTTAQMKGYLQQLVAASTQEAACLQYELYQSTEDETQFIFHETWADQPGLDLHNGQPHLQTFKQQIADIIDGTVTVYKTDRAA
ncbi:putative quinol monooxygenase [Mucilaginibacter gynuensis]